MSEAAIKIRCNKSRQGSANKKDKIHCRWVNDTTFRSFQAKKSKSKGGAFELDIIKELESLGYKGLVSSRSQSKNLDNAKACPYKDRPLVVFWKKQRPGSISKDYVIMPKELLYKLMTQ